MQKLGAAKLQIAVNQEFTIVKTRVLLRSEREHERFSRIGNIRKNHFMGKLIQNGNAVLSAPNPNELFLI